MDLCWEGGGGAKIVDKHQSNRIDWWYGAEVGEEGEGDQSDPPYAGFDNSKIMAVAGGLLNFDGAL